METFRVEECTDGLPGYQLRDFQHYPIDEWFVKVLIRQRKDLLIPDH